MCLLCRLSELVAKADAARGGVHFASDIDTLLPCVGKGGKKCDIYRLGIVLLSLAQGSVVDAHPTELPAHLPSVLRDFLEKCLLMDERMRWSAEQLLAHDFVRLPPAAHSYQQLREHRKKLDNDQGSDDDDDECDVEDIPFIPAPDSASRLQNEFHILRSLGKGAFGDVIKVD